MNTAIDDVRTAASPLESQELLKKPISVLLGVSEAATVALGKLGIRTVFDLGASNLFATARTIVELGQVGTPATRFGVVAGDLLTDDVAGQPVEHVGILSLHKMRILADADTQELSTALDVTSIHDFAYWPPHRTAQRIVGELIGSGLAPADLYAEQLRPKLGEYPTERVYYSTLVMLQMGGAGGQQDLNSPVSLDPAVQNPGGFNEPAVGALVTFQQSWFAQGLTLGQMLHSLALAPGEATRIAVIDWSRRTQASSTETISESELLSNAALHNRAVSEVQQAVATDFERGGSRSSSASTSKSRAEAWSEGSGLIESALGDSGDWSLTTQNSSTRAAAESSSWSLGNRSVMSNLQQNVNDRTEQHSTSVRNRRASAVREVSQNEHQEVSSRIVANYNHMHALTIQYYEVVQVYRTLVQFHRADRLLFIPMQLLDFRPQQDIKAGIAIVDRFRAALIRAALNTRVRSLLIDDTTSVTITPAARVQVSSSLPAMTPVIRVTTTPWVVSPARNAFTRPAAPTVPTAPTDATPVSPQPASSSTVRPVWVWDEGTLAVTSHLLGRPLIRPDSEGLHVPDQTELIALSFDGVSIRNVRLDHVGSNVTADGNFTVPADAARLEIPRSIQLNELEAIFVSKTSDPAASGTMTLHCSYFGRRFSLPPLPIDLGAGLAMQKAVTLLNDQADRQRELLTHLQTFREYYSRAVFRSLDSATLTMVLSKFRWNGKSLTDQVEPMPYTVAGNYLVMRAPVDGEEDSGVREGNISLRWTELLQRRGLLPAEGKPVPTDERLIPIPTAGVFAEAVLGSSNSAEKLDITRFWNWQDSPTPLQPAEIAPIGTESRATTEDLKPGQLASPVLNILNPTALPSPDSMAAILTSLATLNLREMSGLAGTQSLTKAGMESTLTAATEAGKLASENMKTEAQKAVSMGQIAADIAKTAITGVPSRSENAGLKGISADGARVNLGRDMDNRGVPGPGGAETKPSGAGPAAMSAAAGGAAGALAGSEGAVPGNATNTPSYSHERAYADNGALGFSPDAVQAVSQPIVKAVASESGSSKLTRPSGPSSTPQSQTIIMTVSFLDINDAPIRAEYSWFITDNDRGIIDAPRRYDTAEFQGGIGIGQESFARLTSGQIQFRALFEGFPIESRGMGSYTLSTDSTNLRIVIHQKYEEVDVTVERGQSLEEAIKSQIGWKIGFEAGLDFVEKINMESSGNLEMGNTFTTKQEMRTSFKVKVPISTLTIEQK